ncbi:MAG: dTDP-4-dehydrorhamnose 3,5-epimerase [Bacteroidota bacterium]
MKVIETPIKDLLVIQPTIFNDSRGYFFESFNQQKFNELTTTNTLFVQDNQAFSSYGVLRGLHYQLNPYSQAKLVSVLHGKVLDVAVDIRKGSSTYGKHFSIELSDENKTQLFVPRGFAHGYVVLSEKAHFFYKCDNFYSKENEGGIAYNDPTLNIDWQIDLSKAILSDKDIVLPNFTTSKNNFE